jgi:DNA polymerase III epsilon subunit-like protein
MSDTPKTPTEAHTPKTPTEAQKRHQLLLKKLRKQLESGEGPNTTTAHLLSTPDGAELVRSHRPSCAFSAHPATGFLHVGDVRSCLLWLAGGPRPQQPCLSVKNTFLLRGVAVVVLEGLEGVEWGGGGGGGGGSGEGGGEAGRFDALRALAHVRLFHEQGKHACPTSRSRKWLLNALLKLPGKEPSLGSAAALAAAAAVAPPPAPSSGRPTTLRELRLRMTELALWGFPLPDGLPGLPACVAAPSKKAYAPPAAQLPPGRVAGASPHAPRCSLPIPNGHVLTRTAHAALHRAFSASFAPCAEEGGGGDVAVEAGVEERLMALDCEMCETEFGLQLARVTVVGKTEAASAKRARSGEAEGGGGGGAPAAADTAADSAAAAAEVEAAAAAAAAAYLRAGRGGVKRGRSGEGGGDAAAGAPAAAAPPSNRLKDLPSLILLDLLVKPEYPVKDYLTKFSGITAELLATAESSFPAAQDAVAALLDGGWGRGGAPPTLAGHSIDCDLRALRIIHTAVADTSLLFPHPRGLPFRLSLRALAKEHLKRDIQVGVEGSGHDSREDAEAALDLVAGALQEGEGVSEGEERVAAVAGLGGKGGGAPALSPPRARFQPSPRIAATATALPVGCSRRRLENGTIFSHTAVRATGLEAALVCPAPLFPPPEGAAAPALALTPLSEKESLKKLPKLLIGETERLRRGSAAMAAAAAAKEGGSGSGGSASAAAPSAAAPLAPCRAFPIVVGYSSVESLEAANVAVTALQRGLPAGTLLLVLTQGRTTEFAGATAQADCERASLGHAFVGVTLGV